MLLFLQYMFFLWYKQDYFICVKKKNQVILKFDVLIVNKIIGINMLVYWYIMNNFVICVLE